MLSHFILSDEKLNILWLSADVIIKFKKIWHLEILVVKTNYFILLDILLVKQMFYYSLKNSSVLIH